jgi:hypothetical protein
MNLADLNCPRCGTYFYVDRHLVVQSLPLHCPGCDAFLEPGEYASRLGATGAKDSLTRAAGASKTEGRSLLYYPAPAREG